MVGVCINLFTDIEEELGRGEQTVKAIRKLAKNSQERFNKIADALELLEKNGWSWTTGCKDIYLYKKVSAEIAKKEFEKLKIDESLYHIETI